MAAVTQGSRQIESMLTSTWESQGFPKHLYLAGKKGKSMENLVKKDFCFVSFNRPDLEMAQYFEPLFSG